jgi:glycosyltransferase involved in cell wall biosynthesis
LATLQNKKVLIITYYWPPAGGPGVQRWVKFVKYLSQKGYELFVITVDEKQASYAFLDNSYNADIPLSIRVYRTPTRELYSLYLRLTGRKNVPFSGFVQEGKVTGKEKLVRFLRTNFFIPDPRKGWNTYAIRKACSIIPKEGITHVITSGPPQSSHLIGLRLKKKFPDLNWLADFRDPWTRVFFYDQLGHSPYSRFRHDKLEKRVLTKADQIIVVSASMKKDFISDHAETNPEKISIIPNGYDEEDFSVDHPQTDFPFTITYTGTLADNYRIEHLLNIVSDINFKQPGSIRFRFIGEICEKYLKMITRLIREKDYEIIPLLPHRQAVEYMLRSHLLLLVIPDAPKNESILTGKLFEYLAARRPILGIGPVHGDAAEILNETQAGKMTDYSDLSGMRDFLAGILNRNLQDENQWKGKNIEKYSRKNLTEQLTRLF